MPRCVRNFWVELEVDGRAEKIATGPRNGGGGFSLTVMMRENGSISERRLRVKGRVRGDGTLTLDTFLEKEGKVLDSLQMTSEK